MPAHVAAGRGPSKPAALVAGMIPGEELVLTSEGEPVRIVTPSAPQELAQQEG